MTNKSKKVGVIVRDSLGNVLSKYESTLLPESYNQLLEIAEECPDTGHLIAVKDCEVDGECGWREFYL